LLLPDVTTDHVVCSPASRPLRLLLPDRVIHFDCVSRRRPRGDHRRIFIYCETAERYYISAATGVGAVTSLAVRWPLRKQQQQRAKATPNSFITHHVMRLQSAMFVIRSVHLATHGSVKSDWDLVYVPIWPNYERNRVRLL
jgi:hypothetical protein